MPFQALPHSDLYIDSVLLTSLTFLEGISWGIMTSFYSACMYSLLSEKATRKAAVLAIWITILWMLASICTVATAAVVIHAYSWKMHYPGGSGGYLSVIWNQPVPVMIVTTYLLTMWFADAMMLWRLIVFYHGFRRLIRGLVFSFMFLLFIGSLATGCTMLAMITFNESLFSTYTLKVFIPCITLSMALSVFVTAFISIRLLLFKRMMETTLGRKEAQASPYTSVAAMLIESAALYTTWSLVFIVMYILNNPGQFVMIATLCHVQVISPTMIVYRVSKGLGWERSTSLEGRSESDIKEAKRHKIIFAPHTESLIGIGTVSAWSETHSGNNQV